MKRSGERGSPCRTSRWTPIFLLWIPPGSRTYTSSFTNDQAEQRRIRRNRQLDEVIERAGDKNLFSRLQGKPAARKRIVALNNANGETKTDFQDIAEIFASFYEWLYESQAEISTLDSNRAALPSITLQELRATIAKAKKNRACADDGLAMEMLQELPDSALTLLAMLLTDVLRATARPPSSWQVSRLTVLLKKGDAKLPKNYRPIAVIPALSKAYSMIVLARVRGAIEQRLPI